MKKKKKIKTKWIFFMISNFIVEFHEKKNSLKEKKNAEKENWFEV